MREANVLIFPDPNSGDTSGKPMQRLRGAEAIGQVLLELSRLVHILLPTHDVRDIIDVAAIAVMDAQMRALF